MSDQRLVFRLHSFVGLMLVAVISVTFALVAGLVLAFRVPVVYDNAKSAVLREAANKARLLELTLTGLEAQLRQVAALPDFAPGRGLDFSLQALLGDGRQFRALYLVDGNGIIVASGLADSTRNSGATAVGGDLSRNPLYRAARDGQPVWSDKYLSAQTGSLVVGVALRRRNWTAIGEIAPDFLHDSVNIVAGQSGDRVLVVDRIGEYIADSENEYNAADNLGDLSIVKAALDGQAVGGQIELRGNRVFAGSARSEILGWSFIVTRPAGMDNPELRNGVLLVAAGFCGALLVGLLLAPFWARRLSRPIEAMIDVTHRYALGLYGSTAPTSSPIAELNAFAVDLQRMAMAIREREAGLARSQERLRASLESTPAVAIRWYSIDGRVLYWNKASETMYGHSAAEAVGTRIDETPLCCRDPAQVEEFLALLRQIELSGKPYGPAEVPLRRKDGGEVVVQATIFAIPGDGDGHIFVCMDVDLTERKRFESDLRESERTLEAIFNASPAAMSVSDADTGFRISSVNTTWERQFQRSRQSVLGYNGAEIGLYADPADRVRFMAALEEVGVVNAEEYELMTGEGSRLVCSVSALITPIRGRRTLIMVSVDITERKRIEAELARLNETLEERVRERTRELAETLDNLRRAQDELLRSEKLAALGALVAGVAHELNTPIGNAVTVASTLLDQHKSFVRTVASGLSRTELNDFVATVGEAGQILDRNLLRAAELVGSFKQLAVDQSSYQRRVFDLHEVVQEVLLAMGPAIRRSGHQVVDEVPDGFRLDSYPGPLGQVLMNLVNNALLHAFDERPGGRVTIRAEERDPGWVDFSVIDDGRGIAARDQNRIFDPFYTTKLGQGGSGLGLHIVFNLVVNLLGGRIDVDSAPGKGAAFHLRIPLAAPQANGKDGRPATLG